MLAKLMARHKRTLTFLANLERHKSIITKEFKIKCRLSREMQVFLDNLLSQHAGSKPCNLIARIYYDFFS
jgi:hypothetical protein